MSSMARTFVIRSAEDAKRLIAFIRLNAPSAIEAGEPLEATVRVHKPHASDAQRSLIWIVNQQIADQAWVAGRQYSAEVWHSHCKNQLLPEETSRGKKKWRYLPNADRELAMSTEDLNRSEKTLYIEALMAFASGLGVSVEILAPELQSA